MAADNPHYKIDWTIIKHESDESRIRGDEPFEVSEFHDNLLLTEGIQLLEDLLIGAGGTAYNNANARLGVGDSTTAESAAHTGLQAATNKTWKPMEATFPSRSGTTLTFRSVFDGSSGNHAWEEFTIVNAADDTGTNLNRKVSAQGTKTAGQSWTLNVTLSFS